jgi:hypothetical protein
MGHRTVRVGRREAFDAYASNFTWTFLVLPELACATYDDNAIQIAQQLYAFFCLWYFTKYLRQI